MKDRFTVRRGVASFGLFDMGVIWFRRGAFGIITSFFLAVSLRVLEVNSSEVGFVVIIFGD